MVPDRLFTGHENPKRYADPCVKAVSQRVRLARPALVRTVFRGTLSLRGSRPAPQEVAEDRAVRAHPCCPGACPPVGSHEPSRSGEQDRDRDLPPLIDERHGEDAFDVSARRRGKSSLVCSLRIPSRLSPRNPPPIEYPQRDCAKRSRAGRYIPT